MDIISIFYSALDSEIKKHGKLAALLLALLENKRDVQNARQNIISKRKANKLPILKYSKRFFYLFGDSEITAIYTELEREADELKKRYRKQAVDLHAERKALLILREKLSAQGELRTEGETFKLINTGNKFKNICIVEDETGVRFVLDLKTMRVVRGKP